MASDPNVFSVRTTPDVKELFKQLAETNGCSQIEMFDRMVKFMKQEQCAVLTPEYAPLLNTVKGHLRAVSSDITAMCDQAHQEVEKANKGLSEKLQRAEADNAELRAQCEAAKEEAKKLAADNEELTDRNKTLTAAVQAAGLAKQQFEDLKKELMEQKKFGISISEERAKAQNLADDLKQKVAELEAAVSSEQAECSHTAELLKVKEEENQGLKQDLAERKAELAEVRKHQQEEQTSLLDRIEQLRQAHAEEVAKLRNAFETERGQLQARTENAERSKNELYEKLLGQQNQQTKEEKK